MGSLPTTTTTDHPLRVAIIGGGVGGLALALGLQHYPHLEVHIYESKPQFSELGAALTMLPNAVWAMRTISPETQAAVERCLSGSVRDFLGEGGQGEEEEKKKDGKEKRGDEPARIYAGTGPEAGTFLGHMLASAGREKGGDGGEGDPSVKNVHRANFLAALAEGLRDHQEGKAHLGRKVVKVRDGSVAVSGDGEGEGVSVEFADGAVERFDAVVGADGVHSAVRRSMFEEGSVYRDPVFAHMVVYRGLVSMEEAVEVFGEKIAKHPTFTMGPGTVLFQYPTDLGRKANMVVMSYQEGPWEEEAWIMPGTRQELELKLQHYGEAGQKWIKLMDKPGLAKWGIHETLPLPYYSKDCVAITGDAAHAMNPMAGSGAGQAFEDMAVLTALFAHVRSKEQIPKAFRAYDLTRRARAQMTVRLAKDMLMNSTFQLPGANNGNIVERLHGMLHSVTGRDIDDQNREAVKLFWEA